MSRDFEEEWGFAPDSDYEVRKTNEPMVDIFPIETLEVLGALEAKTVGEVAQSLLEQVKKLKEKYE